MAVSPELQKLIEAMRTHRMVTADGRVTPEFLRLLILLFSRAGEETVVAVESAETANQAAEDAASAALLANQAAAAANTAASGAAYVGIAEPNGHQWTSDPSGAAPAGDPTADLEVEFYDPEGNLIATRTMRGTLESASGNITVTTQAEGGQATTVSISNNGTTSVVATVRYQVPTTGATVSVRLSWQFLNISAPASIPVYSSGGGLQIRFV